MPVWMRWMLVDSKGSRKPDDNPSAMTFLSQALIRRPGANFTGQDDAIGRHQGFARHTRFGVARQKGVDNNVRNTVGHLIGVAFGNAFAGEDIVGAHGLELSQT